jgi:hypothetical protein
MNYGVGNLAASAGRNWALYRKQPLYPVRYR